jgi:hypothetical protein
MKRSGFKKKTLAEVQAKQAVKRHTTPKVKIKSKTATKRKPKTKTLAQLKKQLDTVFSIYIRTTHSVDGICTCYTCGKTGTIKELQNGHFVSRGYTATRWHEDNCRPQCVGCNIFGNGKPLDFEDHLKKDFTDEYIEEIKAMRHLIVKHDRQWYLEQIEKYKI